MSWPQKIFLWSLVIVLSWLAAENSMCVDSKQFARGNPLSEDQVARYIDGRAEVKAHGPRGMPVWGSRFYYKSGANKRRAQQWIVQLVDYPQSIQSPIRQVLVK